MLSIIYIKEDYHKRKREENTYINTRWDKRENMSSMRGATNEKCVQNIKNLLCFHSHRVHTIQFNSLFNLMVSFSHLHYIVINVDVEQLRDETTKSSKTCLTCWIILTINSIQINHCGAPLLGLAKSYNK